ncbi:glycosyltransferase [Methylobacter sp.]|uniref:nucleotide disphospho-sugar-binding domain-containing protein n=1 Tax=Methylobacter sp. TaxID=2051955 RepID=UPI002486D402|nr:glycosyltransferase [Methylobacter sp.]MDI1279130.1 glycosyltransferase [Methylobacter sp.]MDI1359948.1 glycosyltransferase [Methylobacter sp.]
MAMVVFCVHPFAGSVYASLKLANDLKIMGHQICYFGVKDCQKFIEPNGFDFIPFFEHWLPENTFTDTEKEQTNKLLNGFEKIREARHKIKHTKACIDALISGQDKEYFEAIAKLKPDLMVIVATNYDSFIWALMAYKAGIKTIYLHDTLCRSETILSPPVASNLVPDDSLTSKIRIALAWKLFLLTKLSRESLFSLIGIGLSHFYNVKKLANHYNYPVNLIDTATDLAAPKLKLVELVTCSAELEFSNTNQVGRYYIGMSIDTGRVQPDFPWQRINDNQPLIYCALGSLNYLKKQERIDFHQIVIDTAKLYKQWNLVIAIGDQLSVEQFQSIPANVVLVNRAPQLDLLKKTSIMINHGGTNTIKECILFGVPMIAFPIGFDHPGNSARVVYHGLGLKGNIKGLTVKKMSEMLEQINNNSYYRIQMKLMRKKIEEVEESKIGSMVINNILSSD